MSLPILKFSGGQLPLKSPSGYGHGMYVCVMYNFMYAWYIRREGSTHLCPSHRASAPAPPPGAKFYAPPPPPPPPLVILGYANWYKILRPGAAAAAPPRVLPLLGTVMPFTPQPPQHTTIPAAISTIPPQPKLHSRGTKFDRRIPHTTRRR